MGIVSAVRDVRTIKRLLTGAEAEARRGGVERPGPEHLLLAATELPDGTALRALAQVGLDPQQLRASLAEAYADALAAVGLDVEQSAHVSAELKAAPSGVFRSTATAQESFRAAVALSKSRRPARLRGADVVAAVCELERGVLPRTLAALGVDRDRLREAALAEARSA